MRACRNQLSTRRRRATGRENMPRVFCSSGVGSTAHQWPSLKRHRSMYGTGWGNSGGNASFMTGCVGTASLFPKDTSWYGTKHDRSWGCEGQGVMMMVGIDGSELGMVKTSSSSCDSR